MLKGDSVLLEHTKNFPPKPNFGIHHGLLNVDGTKAFSSGNTSDGVARLSAGALYDQSTLVLRTVGVADIDRDTLFSYREDGILMEYACAHVSQFTKFFVGDGLNDLRVLHDARIGYQEAGYIGPVLVEVCVDGTGYDGAGYIRTAAGEGLDAAVVFGTVEARDYSALYMLQTLGKLLVGKLCLKIAVLIKENDLSSVNELVTEIIRHNDTV